ncbi:MAG: hypothetical protein N2249_05705 [Melioribacter sp.]|nr:hypothetical protein [Melioribacter sp.]
MTMKINYKTLAGISLIAYGILNILNYKLLRLSAESILGIPLIIFGIPSVFVSFSYKKRNMIVLSTVIFYTGLFLTLDGFYKVYSYLSLILFVFFLSASIFLLLFIENTNNKSFLYSSLLLFIISYPTIKIIEYLESTYFFYRYIKIENIILPLILILVGIILFIKREN